MFAKCFTVAYVLDNLSRDVLPLELVTTNLIHLRVEGYCCWSNRSL